MCINTCWNLYSLSHKSSCIFIVVFIFSFFSTMPELHINGRFPYHNSSLENNAIGASYDASSILIVTGRSFNSTNPTSVPTYTMDSEFSLCGIVSFIIFVCFTLVTLIAIGIWLSRNRRIIKTRKSQDSNESFKMEPLSPPNAVQTCNWTIPHEWIPQCDSMQFKRICD